MTTGLCECGCGMETKISTKTGSHNRFIFEHVNKGRKPTEETRKKQSLVGKGRVFTEEHKQKISIAQKSRPPISESTRLKMSKSQKGRTHTEASRLKMSESRKNPSIETRNKLSLAGRNRVFTEAHRNNLSAAQTGNKNHQFGKCPSEETRKKMSISQTGRNHSPETKRKMSDASKGENSPNWKGGISFLPYCLKFNNAFKESIRDEFNRECFICGKTETEQKEQQIKNDKRAFRLSIHHVNYDKSCLCESITCKFVPLCVSCHAKTNIDRVHWEQIIIEKLVKT